VTDTRPPPGTKVSVVVRSKNEAACIGRAMLSLRAQTVRSQIVLVDSGSTDDTLSLAAPFCDEVVRIPPDSFSFGRALNLGAERSSGDIVFALSAHCVAEDPAWMENSLVHYHDPAVAGTTGVPFGPDYGPLKGPRPISFHDVRSNPRWGFSNHASSWRRTAWEAVPFNEALDSCEDKYWMWQVMLASWVVIADERLVVGSSHRRAAGMRALWARKFTEHRVVAEWLDCPTGSAADLVREWWGSFPWPSRRPPWQRRLSPLRTAEIVAGYLGEWEGARRRGPGSLHLPTPPTAD